WLNEKSIVDLLMDIAGYTYGPLLGLFAFGILTKRSLRGLGIGVITVCLAAPSLTFALAQYSQQWFYGYVMGVENLIVNGTLTFFGLFVISLFSKNEIK
ncbi:MAG: sodium:solute symporter, partial [Bacteroidota bacterium]